MSETSRIFAYVGLAAAMCFIVAITARAGTTALEVAPALTYHTTG